MQKTIAFFRENPGQTALTAVTFVLILVSGILCRVSFLMLVPVFLSLVILQMIAAANRYGYLLNCADCLLYGAAFFAMGLYGQTAFEVLVAAPCQYLTFYRWGKHPCENATVFHRLSNRKLLLFGSLYALAVGAILFFLTRLSSNYAIIDSIVTVNSTASVILSAMVYVEYTYLGVLNSCLSLVMYAQVLLRQDLTAVPYLILTLYALLRGIQTQRTFLRLWRKQNGKALKPA